MSIESLLLQKVLDEYVTDAQKANFASMMAPGAGYLDAAGQFPSPGGEELSEAFTGEPYPSFAENIERGGMGYLDAGLQGLGVAGDTLYAAPFVGPPLGTALKGLGAFGLAMRAGSKAGKTTKPEEGIATLGKQPMFTPEDTLNLAYTPDGSYSPGIKDLIEKASPKLRGQGIVQWANKNLKPKELEVLGIDEFIKANPKATLRETVEGISGNKVVVGKKVLGGNEGQVMDFDITTPLEDPLDGSLLYQNKIDDIEYDLDQGNLEDLQYYADLYSQRMTQDELASYGDEFTFADVIERTEKGLKSGFSNETVDDVIDQLARIEYEDAPVEIIRPTGVNVGDNTFAAGNEEIGYSLFVDGKRVTDPDYIAYSQTEAQIQLRDRMADKGYDMFRVDADDYDEYELDYIYPTQYKTFIDNSLPGGKNYREIIYTHDNATETHSIGHFGGEVEEGNYLAHALVRDRKLADGTETLHGDELQSDLHRDGAKYDYRTPEKLEEIQSQLKANTKETLKQADIVEDMLIKKGVYDKTTPDGVIQAARIEDYLKNIKDYYKLNAYDYAQVEADDFVFFLKGLAKPKDADNYNPLTDFQWTADEFELLSDFAFDTKNSKRLQSYMNDLVPNYPYKDDYHEMLLKKMLLQAVEEGKPAISISGSAPIKARYVSGNDAVDEKNFRFYENLYDKKIPSAMDKLAKKYGGEFEKNSMLDLKDTFVGREQGYGYSNYSDNDIANANANVIKITEEMRNKILLEGIPDFATGGIVNKGIATLRTAKQPTEGIVDLGLY